MSGYTAKIDYSGKGWLSGKKNSFTASLYPEGKEKEPIYVVDGQWTDDFIIKEVKTKKVVDQFSPKVTKCTPLRVAPVEEQGEMESRRAWKKVADAIIKGDTDTAGLEKSIIENQQRELRKKEKEESREWERKYFSRTQSHSTFEALAKKIGEPINDSQTNGIWIFDAEKASKAGR